MASSHWLFSLLVVIMPQLLTSAEQQAKQLIVWNVGQGQWLTLVSPKSCIHFDTGGEFQPPKDQLHYYCDNKKNEHYLSHFDWDHINYLSNLKKQFPNLCRHQAPVSYNNKKRERYYVSLPKCVSTEDLIYKIFPHKSTKTRSKNANSQVFIVEDILIPGDSTQKEEKIWALSNLENIKIIILGHHGSNTSTGNFLLSQLPKLKLAIGSSRRARYGHPHPSVQKRLRIKKTPLLTTQMWGHIHVNL